MRFIIVEDEKTLNNVLHDYLKESFPDAQVDQFYQGIDALDALRSTTYDVVLLDVMLPGVDGFAIAKELRLTSKVPIIMLSALSDEDNQLRGYELGIDEYVKKPYSPKLVMKKVAAILARYHVTDNQGTQSYGMLRYDLASQRVWVQDQSVELNHNEWELFNLFVHNIGVVFTREALLNKVWGYDYDGDERTVDTHVKRLRQKLGEAADYVHTVYRVGYQFTK